MTIRIELRWKVTKRKQAYYPTGQWQSGPLPTKVVKERTLQFREYNDCIGLSSDWEDVPEQIEEGSYLDE